MEEIQEIQEITVADLTDEQKEKALVYYTKHLNDLRKYYSKNKNDMNERAKQYYQNIKNDNDKREAYNKRKRELYHLRTQSRVVK